MKKISNKQILIFQNKILKWYGDNKRSLPWRTTVDPYKIHVSECMLQQTQVDRVIPYYNKFVKKYPSVSSLAKANRSDLLKIWSGLGYNNRVLRLQATAQILTKNKIPYSTEYEQLVLLPGIGPYTANAILAFAFNKEVAVIDTNIRRVLLHEFSLPFSTSQESLNKIALCCIPKNNSCIWHNALMDYGALHATARKTKITSLSKQSKFIGSNREVRGFIIKSLIKKNTISITYVKNKFPDRDILKIISALVKDGMILKKGNSISLSK